MKYATLVLEALAFVWFAHRVVYASEEVDLNAWFQDLEELMNQQHAEALAELDRQHVDAVQKRKELLLSRQRALIEFETLLAQLESQAPEDQQDLENSLDHRILKLSPLAKAMKCVNKQKSSKTKLVFQDCNVFVNNGAGQTNSKNGYGNVIVGYNEKGCNLGGSSCMRSGSHNLVVGRYHEYDSTACVLAGEKNTCTGAYSTIIGGTDNVVSGDYSTIRGGFAGSVTGIMSSVTGGQQNSVAGTQSSVLGGLDNSVTGDYSTIVSGVSQLVSGNDATLLGGSKNNIASNTAVICGGRSCNAKVGSDASAILGGNSSATVSEYQRIP